MANWILAGLALTVMLLNIGMIFKMLLVLDDLKMSAALNVRTLEDIQEAAVEVAKDLAARYVRADAVEGAPGEAADVAARSEPDSP